MTGRREKYLNQNVKQLLILTGNKKLPSGLFAILWHTACGLAVLEILVHMFAQKVTKDMYKYEEDLCCMSFLNVVFVIPKGRVHYIRATVNQGN